MLRILDSDHVAALDRGGNLAERLRRRLRASGDQSVVTILTLEEQLRGWLAQIKRATTPDAEIQAYEKLLGRFRFFERWTILPWTRESSDPFQRLRSVRSRIGTMDLRIASIALAHDATLLTRNVRDFEQVPGLRVENWLD